MTALTVIGVIVLLVFLLLMTSAKVRVISDGDITLKVGAGPLMLKILPKKEKKLKLRKFSHKKYLALIEAEKAAKISREAEKQAKKEEKKSKPNEKREKGSIVNTISLVVKILERLDVYTGRLRTVVTRLDVTVGGADAASAAVTYGIVSQSVSYLIELLDCKTKLKLKDTDSLAVKCDYTGEGIGFIFDLTVKLRILDALRTGVDVLLIKLKHDSENANNKNSNNDSRKAGLKNGR